MVAAAHPTKSRAAVIPTAQRVERRIITTPGAERRECIARAVEGLASLPSFPPQAQVHTGFNFLGSLPIMCAFVVGAMGQTPSVPELLSRFLVGAEDVSSPASRNRILVVDDDPVVRLTFQRSLELANYGVVVASGGAEGLRILREDPTIGLVLLDLLMPEMDGWKFRHAQRSNPRLAAIPTIIITGSSLAQVVHEELQAADYLLKPVARDHLMSVVAAYCKPYAPTAAD
jgi:two-component system, chemotaxis family, chemotaxis protein CheY